MNSIDYVDEQQVSYCMLALSHIYSFSLSVKIFIYSTYTGATRALSIAVRPDRDQDCRDPRIVLWFTDGDFAEACASWPSCLKAQ